MKRSRPNARPYDRDAALDAALRLFWAKGYHATSLKDLEAALTMKPGSIYAAFQSKEALFLAALERYFLRNRAGLAARLAAAMRFQSDVTALRIEAHRGTDRTALAQLADGMAADIARQCQPA
jgi:AcrR family transcriptional regulator